MEKDQESRTFLAHVVFLRVCGGVDHECQIILDMKNFGIHRYVSLRSDQAPAITALLDEVCRSRPGTRTLAERPSANVLAERAIQ